MRSPAIWAALAATLPLAACAGFGFGGGGASPPAAAVAAPPPPAPALATAPAPPAVSAAPLPAVSAAPLPAAGSLVPAPPSTPPPAALAKLGPAGATLSDADRVAAFNALGGALDSGQRKSWRGAQGVFGFVEPGAETGGGCRSYSQTIYVAGRPNKTSGTACKQADGGWLPST